MTKKVYFVDDDPQILALLNDCCQSISNENFFIRTFISAQDCLNQIKADLTTGNPPRLLYTDINMPVMDGVELIKNVQSLNTKIRLGVISSEPSLESLKLKDKVECWQKPIQIFDFIKRLEEALDE